MSKKLLIIVVCAALAVAGAAMSTVAFLTDRAQVTNVFTVGDVQITVDETKVNQDGVPVDEEGNLLEDGDIPARAIENYYHLLPGRTYTKDPAVTVIAGNEECYIRMMVTVSKYSEVMEIMDFLKTNHGDEYPLGLPREVISAWDPETWILKGSVEDTVNNTVTYEFRYYETVPTQADNLELTPLFGAITVPGYVTGDQLAAISDMEITVVGHAIQKATFANEDAAWAAFENQNDPVDDPSLPGPNG